jgi:hypothetical protein
VRFRVDTSEDQLVDFARKLANDDNFRDRLQQDPEAVLGEFNIDVPRGQLDRGRGVELPSKREMQEAIRGSGQAEPEVGPFIAFVAFIAFIRR